MGGYDAARSRLRDPRLRIRKLSRSQHPYSTRSATIGSIREALRAKEEGKQRTILFNLCGHGHFDMQSYIDYQAGKLQNYEYPAEEIAIALAGAPTVA